MIKPTPIISGYMIRHFILSFIGVLLIIMGLVFLFDIIELLRRTANRDSASFLVVIEMAFLKLPNMLHTLLPFAVMIGSMVAFWRLNKSRELVIIRSAGVSVWGFLFPVALVTFLIGIFNITAFNPIAALMFKRYENYEDNLTLRHSSPLVVSQHGLWLREATEEGYTVVHAKEVRQEEHVLIMRHISVIEVGTGEKIIRRIEAKIAKLYDGFFEMENGWIMEPGKPSQSFEKNQHKTSLTMGRIQENFASPETISFWELPSFIKFFESAGFTTHRHRLYWNSLIASPLLLCSMVFIAAVFSLSPNLRQGSFLVKIVGGLITGFAFYFFSRITFALGLSSTLPLQLAAWSPAIISMLLSVSMLLHLEDG